MIEGFLRFDLTLGDRSTPVEAFVLKDPGPDYMLKENSAMSAFEGIFDREAETLTFRKSTA